ncbi:MAG: tetratricopeptide repeat protein [Candidatus Hydrogenedentes bacterium]|nr:tetratricopeptide repeat protein [Candidatus Hydrogenedentota bacterium]
MSNKTESISQQSQTIRETLKTSKYLMEKACRYMRKPNYENALLTLLEAIDMVEESNSSKGFYEGMKMRKQLINFGNIQAALDKFKLLTPVLKKLHPNLYKEIKARVESNSSSLQGFPLKALLCGINSENTQPLLPQTAALLKVNLGKNYWFANNYEKALFWQKEGIAVLKKSIQETPVSLFRKSFTELSFTYERLQDYRAVIDCFEELLGIVETHLKSDEEDLIDCLSRLKRFYCETARFEDAVLVNKRLMKIYEGKYGKNSDEVAYCLSSIKSCYEGMNKWDEAFYFHELYIECRRNTLPQLIGYLRNLADDLVIQKKYNKAEKIYKQIIKLYQQNSEKDEGANTEVMKALLEINKAREKTGQ